MVREFESYGSVLTYTGVPDKNALSVAALDLSPSKFSPENRALRPPAWEAVKRNRVAAKELVSGADPLTLSLMRPQRLEEVSYIL
jgi:hypothetical protein